MKDPIVQTGEPILRERAKPVAHKDFGSRKLTLLIAKMKKALAQEPLGVAIAAPQVGTSLRLFIIAGKAFLSHEEKRDGADVPPDMVFINPTLVRLSRKTKEMTEGCLSVRTIFGTVLRHEKATIEAYDEHGKRFTYHGSELIAHIFQHEVDHLDGILYTDKAENLHEDKDE